MKKYDKLDMMILKELRKDGKTPYRKLAEKLGAHPNTLMQRIKRLEKEGVIQNYAAQIDYSKIGFGIQAVVMIRIKKRGLDDPHLLKEIARLPQVTSLYATTGGYDCIATIHAKDKDDLLDVLQRIQSDEKVLRTTSQMILVTYKNPSEFNPLEQE